MSDMQSVPIWLQISSGLLTPLIAIFGAYIAWQQWNLGRSKLKLELFDRRFALYKAIQHPVLHVLHTGSMDDKTYFKFRSEIGDAKWMLNEEIYKYADDDLTTKLADLLTKVEEAKVLEVGEIRTRNVREQRELKEWITSQRPHIDEMFGKFLRVSH